MRPTSNFANFLDCPICGKKECDHFLGWTEDGRHIEPKPGLKFRHLVIGQKDQVIKTGVSARVYRPSF